MNKLILTIVMGVMVSSCGKNAVPKNDALILSHIVGGEKVKEANVYTRRTVGLYNLKTDMVCTGAIIEDDLILTAAHCVLNAEPGKLEIVFGNRMLSLSSGSIKMNARSIYDHKGYDGKTFENDMALIRLEKKIPSGYQAVDLEDSRELVVEKDQKVTSVGYGVNNPGSLAPGRGILRMTELAIAGYEDNERFLVINQQNGIGLCFGDSGGPTFMLVNGRPVLVGITSYVTSVEKKNKCRLQSFISNPAYYYSWIQESKLKI